jgi:hypothetical protein
MSLIAELKRRNVFRVGAAYAIVGWLLVEVASVVLPTFKTPEWVMQVFTFLVILGFPLALILAWAFELTPEGLKLDRDVGQSQPMTPNTIKKLKDAKTAVGQLNSLVYKSRCKSVVDLDLVDSILASSTRNNAANGVTGVLIATRTHFLQVLEGGFEALNETFERISSDTRHDNIQLISFAEIEERRFSEWAMHGIGLFDLNHELAIKLCKKFGEENGNVRLPSTTREVTDFLSML